MSLAAGDVAIINAVYRYRFVTTSQLALLLGRAPQVIRRANRKRLRPGGFLVNFNRLPSEEAAYTLGPNGLAFVARELGCSVADLPMSKSVGTARSFFFDHLLMITRTRVAFDMAAADPASRISIQRTIPEWETARSTRPGASHHDRFILSERFKGPDGQTTFHRPDCLFLVSPKEAPHQLVAVFCECDRASESMTRISHKLQGYFAYYCRRRFVEAFDAAAMRVLFVVDVKDHVRIDSMRETLRQFAGQQQEAELAEAFRRCFRFALASELDQVTALTKPIFRDAHGNRRLFFQPVDRLQRVAEQRAEATS